MLTTFFRKKALSGSALKIIALLLMVVDHVFCFLYVGTDPTLLAIGETTVTVNDFVRGICRIVFPIYAFLLVEGFHHTHDKKKYGLRLLMFAAISEVPWDLLHTRMIIGSSQSVYVTLFLGFLGMCVLSSDKDTETKAVCAVIILLASLFANADYGCRGVGFILLLYVLRDQPIPQAVIGSCILSSTWKAGLAFIPINLYNGERGMIKGKYWSLFFYTAYPLHLLIIYLIRRSMFGY